MPEKDSELTLPQFCVLKASAGSGKTHTLTKRYVQLLLSSVLPQNSLKNVLAITFSNNAALEMKERVIAWLKDLYREEPSKTAEIQQIVSCGPAELKARAEMLLETIFDNYSDFQIKTIDSFMAAIFKASALEFGYPPDFEILLNSSQVMAYAFDLFLRGAREGSKEGELLDGAVSLINAHKGRDSAFNWNPSRPLLEEIIKINRKGVVPSAGSFRQVEVELQPLKVEIKALVTEIQGFLVTSGLERTKRDPLGKVFECLTEGRFLDLLGIGMKQRPVKKPSSKNNDLLEKHTLVLDKWATLNSLVSRLAILYSRLYYFPYLKTLNSFSPFLENIKRREGKIFIEDVTLKLSEFISQSIVPDIYFKIGETVYHYLMDEFQDTSPLQWNNLLPLIQNPISQGGTLFAVGDTKQAIYLFRDADYRIMKGFETTNPFPSAAHLVRELGT
ncbi:MAG: UvrD-helicase domain-containing protein, partial [Nitrospinota bacterium]